MSDIKIACVGNLTDDQLLYIDAIPSLDDVAYVNKSTRCMGGRGALVALILGRAKLVPSLVTVLPQSEKAYEYETFLNKNNVCTKAVHFSETSDSLFEVIIAISREQKNCISFFKPTDILFEVNEVQKETVRDSDIVYFSTHKRSFNRVLLNEIDLSKSCIVHNVSSYFLQDSEYTDLMLQKSNILIFNESEEELLLRNLGISGARELFNIAPRLEVLFSTHGERGSVVYQRTWQEERVEAQKVSIISPVGAGDAYSAGILYGLAQRWSLSCCAQFASELASLSVGSKTSYPDLEGLDSLILKYGGAI